jgi:SAM-dependent methyltransferase
MTSKAPETPAPLDANLLLHESRGAMLRGMPKGAERILSAGCSGTWYFDWVEKTYGSVKEHIGIEFFSEKPSDLPGNVTWIANTASDMSAVHEASVDLVFSGQNLEHLWPDEVAGFVLEAARVLRIGGHLVIDSPNRLITAAQNWSHPQHTIELTCEEAAHLVSIAGFDVTALRGIWLCRDPKSGEDLPFDPNLKHADWSTNERLLCAREHPGESFIWWLEAVRTDRAPDPSAAYAFMDDLFRRHWPERTQRFLSAPGVAVEPSAEGDWLISAPGGLERADR